MAQYFSSALADFRGFSFLKAYDYYDTHETQYSYPIYDSNFFPGLTGSCDYQLTIIFKNNPDDFSSGRDPFDEHIIAGSFGGVNGFGVPSSGTIGAFARLDAGSPLYYVMGLSMDAAAYKAALATAGSADDLALWKLALGGNDSFKLYNFSDYVSGYSGNDTIQGGFGDDTLFGDTGADRVLGEYGDDRLFGGLGGDRLNGGDGADILTGAESRDILDGGVDTNRDVFVFANASHSVVGDQRDVIWRFVSGVDDLRLTQMDANTRASGDQNFTFNGTAAKANAIWYAASTDGIIVMGDVNGDRLADFEIKLMGVSAISAGDVLL